MSKFILILLFYWFTILCAVEFGRKKAMETAKNIMDTAFFQTKELIHTQIEQAERETADENETTD